MRLGFVLILCASAFVRARAQDSVRVSGRVLDATTDVAVDGASILLGGRAIGQTGNDGRFVAVAGVGDTLVIRRIGFRMQRVPLATQGEIVARLVPVAAPLATVRVEATTPGEGRLVTSAASATARDAGAVTAGDFVARMPFVTTRAAPGRTVVSVRAARPEQVVVTLDGVPLNDPASGAADLSDVPLGAVERASVVPGAGVAAGGPGATGGVIALNSGDRSRLTTSVGSYGARAVDGAWAPSLRESRLRIGGAWSTARNDFTFRNTAAAPPADTAERRVNDDVARTAAFGSLVAPAFQLVALASRVDRGLVGPIDVRAFDADRGRTRRALARMTSVAGGWVLGADVRALDNAYHDPVHPSSDARVWSASGEVEASRAIGATTVRVEGSNDRVGGSALRTHDRPRGAAAVSATRRFGGFDASTTLRLDVIQTAGTQLSPTVSVSHPGRVTLNARWSQAFRAPSFYDLYLASPQRVTARELGPERVVLDAEVGATFDAPLRVGAAVFVRRTRNAIVWFPGNVGWAPTNVPDERVMGAELRVAGDVGPVALAGWAAAYHTRLWDGFAATRTPYVPLAEGGARATLSAHAWTASAAADFIGRRPFVSGPPSRAIELPSATVLSAFLVRHVAWSGRRVDVSLAVNDLGDSQWESVRRYPTPGRTFAAGLTLEL